MFAPGVSRTPGHGLGNRCSIHLSYGGARLDVRGILHCAAICAGMDRDHALATFTRTCNTDPYRINRIYRIYLGETPTERQANAPGAAIVTGGMDSMGALRSARPGRRGAVVGGLCEPTHALGQVVVVPDAVPVKSRAAGPSGQSHDRPLVEAGAHGGTGVRAAEVV